MMVASGCVELFGDGGGRHVVCVSPCRVGVDERGKCSCLGLTDCDISEVEN